MTRQKEKQKELDRMLDFRPLQLEDLPRLRPYFAYSGSRLCDTTPGTVFIWQGHVPHRIRSVGQLSLF